MVNDHIDSSLRAKSEAEAVAQSEIRRLTQVNDKLTEECQRVEAELAELILLRNQSVQAINEQARLNGVVRPP